MTFGRSEAEFWQMTPAQLRALSDAHRRAHDPKRSGRGQASQGTTADLLALAAMRAG